MKEEVGNLKLKDFLSQRFMEDMLDWYGVAKQRRTSMVNKTERFFQALCNELGLDYSSVTVKEFPFERLSVKRDWIKMEGLPAGHGDILHGDQHIEVLRVTFEAFEIPYAIDTKARPLSNKAQETICSFRDRKLMEARPSP